MRIILILLILIMVTPVHAQTSEFRNEIKLLSGWAGFIDEDLIDHAVIGGNYRRYLTRNTSIEGEFLYMQGPGTDRDFVLMPSIARDLGNSRKVRPYLVAGAGLLHHRERFGSRTFTDKEWTASGGAGAKIFFRGRFFIAPEARLGWEPLLRFTVGVGWAF